MRKNERNPEARFGWWMLAAMVLIVTHTVLRAVNTDDQIEAAAKDSYVFKTYLADDNVDIRSDNGAVTLKGTVAEESHRSMAQETVAGLPGVKTVTNKLEISSRRVR